MYEHVTIDWIITKLIFKIFISSFAMFLKENFSSLHLWSKHIPNTKPYVQGVVNQDIGQDILVKKIPYYIFKCGGKNAPTSKAIVKSWFQQPIALGHCCRCNGAGVRLSLSRWAGKKVQAFTQERPSLSGMKTLSSWAMLVSSFTHLLLHYMS